MNSQQRKLLAIFLLPIRSAHHFLAPLLTKFSKDYPKLKLSIRFGTTREVAEKILEGAADLGMTIGHLKMPTLKHTLLRKGNFVLVRSKRLSNFKLKNVSNESFILTEPRIETEQLKKQFYKHFKTQLRVSYEVSSWEMIADIAAEGLGVGFVPDLLLRSKDETIAAIKADWLDCPYEMFLIQSHDSSKRQIVSIGVEVIRSIVGS